MILKSNSFRTFVIRTIHSCTNQYSFV